MGVMFLQIKMKTMQYWTPLDLASARLQPSSKKNQDIDKKILSFRLKRWLIQSKKTKSLFQDELIQLSAEERALGSDYELEKALGSK